MWERWGDVERQRKSNGFKRWMAKTPNLLTMAPETRSATHRVTHNSTASGSAKEKCGMESAAVAKMPLKRKGKKPVKVAEKRRVAKEKRVTSVDKGEGNRREGLCTEYGEPGYYGTNRDLCDSEALCVISMHKNVPPACFPED
jgi:hypothetical protein